MIQLRSAIEDECELSISDGYTEEGDITESESTNGSLDEDRLRQFFLTCDGFISSSAHDIMLPSQLGGAESSRFSFDDFLRRRTELLTDGLKAALPRCLSRSASEEEDEFWPTDHYDSGTDRECVDSLLHNSTAIAAVAEAARERGLPGRRSKLRALDDDKLLWLSSTSAKDSDSALDASKGSVWELIEEPAVVADETMSIQHLIEGQGIPIPPDCFELLELANTIHQSDIKRLKRQIADIKTRLLLAFKERDQQHREQIDDIKKHDKLLIKEMEKKRARDVQRYQNRLTELSQVISSLSDRVEQHQYEQQSQFEQDCVTAIPAGQEAIGSDEADDDNRGTDIDSLKSVPIFRRTASGERNLKELKERIKGLIIENNSFKLELKARDKEIERLRKCVREAQHKEKELVRSNSEESAELESSIRDCLRTLRDEKTADRAVEAVTGLVERFKRKILHLRSQMDVVCLSLDESKSSAQKLTELLGKYDSNNTALKMNSSYFERMVVCYEVLNRLLESEMGLLLASCRAAGLGKILGTGEEEEQTTVLYVLEKAKEKRERAEARACELIKNLCEEPDKELFTKDDENQIRSKIAEYKQGIQSVTKSIVSVDMNEVAMAKEQLEQQQDIAPQALQQRELENASMLQELMALREAKAELETKLFVLSKEKTALDIQINSNTELQRSYVTEITRLSKELSKTPADDCTLKKQIKELMVSLEILSMNFDRQLGEYIEIVEELKRENNKLKFKLFRSSTSKSEDPSEPTEKVEEFNVQEATQELQELSKETE